MAQEVFYQIHHFAGPPIGTFPQEVQYTLSGGPGLVPKAVLVFFAPQVASAWDTIGSTARLSVGFFDGTNQRACAYFAEDLTLPGAGTAGGRIDTASVIQCTTTSGPGLLSEAEGVSFSNDSVTLEWNTNQDGEGAIVFFFGSAVNAAVGHLASSASIGGTASVTGLSFTPDMILAACVGQNFVANGQFNEAALSFGFAGRAPSITQACGAICAEHLEATSSVGTIARNDAFATHLLSAAGTVTEQTRLEMTSFQSGGFTVTTRNNAAALQFMYLALDLGGRHVYCGANSITAGTLGLDSLTEPGFRPELLFVSAVRVTAANTLGSTQGTMSVGVGTGASAEAGFAVNARDNLATADTHSRPSNTSLIALIATGTTYDYIADLDSFDATGATFDVTDAAAADRILPWCVVEDRPALVASDTVDIQDGVVLRGVLAEQTAETVGLSESCILIIHKIIVDETVGIDDICVLKTGGAGDLLIVCDETVGISDHLSLAGLALMIADDAVGLTETTPLYLGNVIVQNDTVGIDDVFSPGQGLIQTISNPSAALLSAGSDEGLVIGAYAEQGDVL